MANPLQSLGVLNRLRANITLNDFPELNVIASFLGEAGIGLRMNGPATTRIPAMTGTVPSPEPYVPLTLTINLLKSQPLAGLYKRQMEDTTLVGDLIVRGDARTLPSYYLSNCSIDDVAELAFSGRDAGWNVSISGNWNVNNAQWG
jgi:hypothetical protein